MHALRSPKNKLLLAAALIAALALLGPLARGGGVLAARVALGALAAGGLGWWVVRTRRPSPAFKLTPQLEVLSRVGLSPKCGVALVEADGRKYLVVHGEGFAEIRESRPRTVPSRAVSAARARRLNRSVSAGDARVLARDVSKVGAP